MMASDEASHLIKIMAGQQNNFGNGFVRGHIATYDDILHRVRCYIPSLRDENDVPTLTGWMPLGSMAAGNGWGIQVIPVGGATESNPTLGEQVLIGIFDPRIGIMAASAQFFNASFVPPSRGGAYSPGDIIIRNASGASFVMAGANISMNGGIDGSFSVSATSLSFSFTTMSIVCPSVSFQGNLNLQGNMVASGTITAADFITS